MTLHAFGNNILKVIKHLLAVFDLPVVVALIDGDNKSSFRAFEQVKKVSFFAFQIVFLSRRIQVENHDADSSCIPRLSFKHIFAVEFVLSRLV